MKELYSSLAKFNQEVSSISKDANNPMFRNNYATIDQIIEAIRPILAKNGLSVIQIPMNLNLSEGGEWVGVKTILLHESGQTLESEPFYLKAQGQKTGSGYAITAQSLGSAITYCRRYSLTSLLCLNTGEFDKDDDGNEASGHKTTQHQTQHQTQPQNKSNNGISEAQMKRFYALLKASNRTKEQAFKWYKDNTSKDVTTDTMTKSDYDTITKALQSIIDNNRTDN